MSSLEAAVFTNSGPSVRCQVRSFPVWRLMPPLRRASFEEKLKVRNPGMRKRGTRDLLILFASVAGWRKLATSRGKYGELDDLLYRQNVSHFPFVGG